MKKIIKCGMLFCSTDESVLENMAIVVEGNKIIGVMPFSDVQIGDSELIDLSKKFVMPGLIDAHVHTLLTGKANCAGHIPNSTYGDLAFEGMVNAQTDMMAGFTSIRDECGAGFSEIAVKRAINQGRIWGPRMLVSGCCITATGGHGDSNFNPYINGDMSGGIICNSPDECRKAARYNFKYGADQIKIMGTGGVASFGDDPGAPEFTFEEMKAAIDVANSRGRISSVHAHGAEGIKMAIRAGIKSVEHGMMIDEEGIDMLAETGVYLIPTIIAGQVIIENGVKSGIPEETVNKAARVMTNHLNNINTCLKKGVKVGFGTDAGTPFNHHGKQAREFELLMKGGFTATQALIAATRINSELFKWDNKVGTIETGKLADIVAFDENPLNNIKTMVNCTFVMKDGTVYKN